MCLSVAVAHPENVLAKGEHCGYEWQVVHNGRGYRCGYVRVPKGHPWHGADYDLDVECHGGITFYDADYACPIGIESGKPEDGYWLGFDCNHYLDLPDPTLPIDEDERQCRAFFNSKVIGLHSDPVVRVRTQEYVEDNCRSLCEQAAQAALAPIGGDLCT